MMVVELSRCKILTCAPQFFNSCQTFDDECPPTLYTNARGGMRQVRTPARALVYIDTSRIPVISRPDDGVAQSVMRINQYALSVARLPRFEVFTQVLSDLSTGVQVRVSSFPLQVLEAIASYPSDSEITGFEGSFVACS